MLFVKMVTVFFILTNSYFVVKDTQTKEMLLQGSSEDGLYPIYLQQLKPNKALSKITLLSSFTTFLGVTTPIQVWHARLGHPSESASLLFQFLVPPNCVMCVSHVKWPRAINSFWWTLNTNRHDFLNMSTQMCGPPL